MGMRGRWQDVVVTLSTEGATARRRGEASAAWRQCGHCRQSEEEDDPF